MTQLSGHKLTPFGESGRSVLLENVAAIEMAVLIEMIVDRGMSGSKLLQGAEGTRTLNQHFVTPLDFAYFPES